MAVINKAMKGIIKLKIVPGMLTPREYVRRFIEQNGISQRKFNKLSGSLSTGFTNQILSGKTTISHEMSDSIGKVLFSNKKDIDNFKALVIIEKAPFDGKIKIKLSKSIVQA